MARQKVDIHGVLCLLISRSRRNREDQFFCDSIKDDGLAKSYWDGYAKSSIYKARWYRESGDVHVVR